MIKVHSTVRVIEVDDKETTAIDPPVIGVDSHWNMSDRVILVVNGVRLTVLEADLQAAIRNATNTAR